MPRSIDCCRSSPRAFGARRRSSQSYYQVFTFIKREKGKKKKKKGKERKRKKTRGREKREELYVIINNVAPDVERRRREGEGACNIETLALSCETVGPTLVFFISFDSNEFFIGLETLDLGENMLKTVPYVVFQALGGCLEALDLDQNQIEDLEQISNCERLEILNLRQNRLTRVEKLLLELRGMKNLHTLDLHENRILGAFETRDIKCS